MIKARSIPAKVSERCDFCHKPIEKGKPIYQIVEGKAQGKYHGRRCYEAALTNYEETQKKEGIEDEDIDL